MELLLQNLESIKAVALMLGTMGGFAALVAVLINFGKKIKIKGAYLIKDGQAPTVSLVCNLIGMVALFIAQQFFPQFDVSQVDTVMSMIATIGMDILTLLGQLKVSEFTHNTTKATVIGKSYSAENLLG